MAGIFQTIKDAMFPAASPLKKAAQAGDNTATSAVKTPAQSGQAMAQQAQDAATKKLNPLQRAGKAVIDQKKQEFQQKKKKIKNSTAGKLGAQLMGVGPKSYSGGYDNSDSDSDYA